MRFAFCVYKHFPFGGLSRDMLRIAQEGVNRGHEIIIFVRDWDGALPDTIPVQRISAFGASNHARVVSFHRNLHRRLRAEHFDAVVGFNKMPGLDVYFAADDCFVARARRNRHPLYRLTPRYRCYARLEEAVFAPAANTEILLLSDQAQRDYREFYGTPDARFALLPPTLDPQHRRWPTSTSDRFRARTELDAQDDELLLLLAGSGFKTKGLDRAIRAVAALPTPLRSRARLLVVGSGKAGPFQRLAQRLGMLDQLEFLGGRDDIPKLLRAADLLIHPAYNEAAGAILLEAIAAGLPVLTTDVCGYACHVIRAEAGVVLASPFAQSALNKKLAFMLQTSRKEWSARGVDYAADPSLYTMPSTAFDIIEDRAARGDIKPAQNTNHGTRLYLRDDFRADLGEHSALEDIMGLDGETYRMAPGRRTLRFVRHGHSYFLKAHFGVGWREIAKNLTYFRLPVLGASNEWHGIHFLERVGIPTMRIAGYGITGRNPARRRSFIVTDEIPATISLEEYCQRWRTCPPKSGQAVRFKRWLIRRLAEIARAMHRNGANHRDFYLCHFLMDLKGRPDNPSTDLTEIYVIDLHRVQLRQRTPLRWLVKDIAGLYYSSMDLGLTKRDLFRFMKIYADEPLRKLLDSESRFWQRVRNRAFNLYANEQRRAQKQASPATRAAVSTSITH